LLPNSTQRAKGLIVRVSPDNQDILIQKPKMESAIGNTLMLNHIRSVPKWPR
jgi:hypothetical protein